MKLFFSNVSPDLIGRHLKEYVMGGNDLIDARISILETRIASLESRHAILEAQVVSGVKTRKRRDLTPEEKNSIRDRLSAGKEKKRQAKEAEIRAEAEQQRSEKFGNRDLTSMELGGAKVKRNRNTNKEA